MRITNDFNLYSPLTVTDAHNFFIYASLIISDRHSSQINITYYIFM